MLSIKRATPVLVALAVLALGVTAAVAATAGAARARGARLELRRTSLGRILTTANGSVAYAFTRDRGRRDSCVHVTGCAAVWPPLWTRGRPLAGRGVRRSLLGTIRVGSREQVTYAGHPLYGYKGGSPGSTLYVGVHSFGGTWRAIGSSGRLVG